MIKKYNKRKKIYWKRIYKIINNQLNSYQYFLVWYEYPLPLTPDPLKLDFLSYVEVVVCPRTLDPVFVVDPVTPVVP